MTKSFLAFLIVALSAIVAVAQPYTGLGSCKHGRKGGPKVAGGASGLDVTHYDITIDSLNLTSQRLWGHVDVHFVGLPGGSSQISLSLQSLIVDSVLQNGSSIPFTHAGTTLQINLGEPVPSGIAGNITVHYHGQPAQDPSWGGFYWSGAYAFNMGVGFEVDPHVFGRAWFPCNDNFTDRATYTFHIKAPAGNMAFCNGVRDSVEILPWGASIHHWHIDQTIPTYLACMAVAPYRWLEREVNGIPAIWACLPTDTTAVLNTFTHLPDAVTSFVNSYGPYRWPRIGYSLVPFNSGAMEHATSIHIGKPFVNGSLTYETLWAHELAHMWWGDLVTCETAEDMWLNEGWAAYSEALFTQAVYGEDQYKAWIRANHRKVLQFAHVSDGAYYAMNNVPHAATYGSTVYEKGPDVIHTLRNHMGEAAFFNACREYMDQFAFGNASSFDLRDAFATSSGSNLDAFFDGWIFQPGFPHFEVDSFKVSPQGNSTFLIDLYLRQKSRGNNHVYDALVPVAFIDGFQETTFWFPISAPTAHHQFTLQQINPKWVAIDRHEQISDAVADREKPIPQVGLYTFEHTNVTVLVTEMGNNESTMRVSDHFVGPDPIEGPLYGHTINPYHYWTLEGNWAEGMVASATFKFDGSTSTSTGYMDNDLIVAEDSLVMLYRPGPGHPWLLAPYQTLNMGTITTNKRGDIKVDSVQIGQYALASRDYSSSVLDQTNAIVTVWPNPTTGSIQIKLGTMANHVEIVDLSGKTVLQTPIINETSTIDLSAIPAGHYQARILSGGRTLGTYPVQKL